MEKKRIARTNELTVHYLCVTHRIDVLIVFLSHEFHGKMDMSSEI